MLGWKVSFDGWMSDICARDEQPIHPTSTLSCITETDGTKGLMQIAKFLFDEILRMVHDLCSQQ